MRFIKKLLGIDEILKNIEDIKAELINQPEENQENNNSLRIISPINNKPLLHIESIIDNPNKYETKNLRPIGSSAKFMSLIQYLPIAQTVQQSKMLEGAFKVVFPEGAVGELMRYKNGLLGTSIVQKGKIIAHAGLEKIQSISLSPVLVFTVLSAVTGQYFMARIDKSLERISRDVRDIISMFLDDKEARSKAIFSFYTYVRENLDMIINNPDLRIATLTNLQSCIVELKQNLLFYESTIKRKNSELDNIIINIKTTGKRVQEFEKVENEVSDLLIQHHICLELLLIGKMYEMQLAQIYDDEYCNNLINDLNMHFICSMELNRSIIGKCSGILDRIEDKAIANIDRIWDQRREFKVNFVKRLEAFEEDVNNTINLIEDQISFNKSEQVFIVKNEELYYLQEVS
jgi:hypothetical protein